MSLRAGIRAIVFSGIASVALFHGAAAQYGPSPVGRWSCNFDGSVHVWTFYPNGQFQRVRQANDGATTTHQGVWSQQGDVVTVTYLSSQFCSPGLGCMASDVPPSMEIRMARERGAMLMGSKRCQLQ